MRPKFGRTSQLRHPRTGDLSLRSDKLVISGTDGLMLIVFQAPELARLTMPDLESQPAT